MWFPCTNQKGYSYIISAYLIFGTQDIYHFAADLYVLFHPFRIDCRIIVYFVVKCELAWEISDGWKFENIYKNCTIKLSISRKEFFELINKMETGNIIGLCTRID